MVTPSSSARATRAASPRSSTACAASPGAGARACRRAEIGGQLDVGGELALADLTDLRVGADQVDVGEARVDRYDLQAQPGQHPAELPALVGPERRAEQVRRRGGQLQRPEPLPGQRT